MTTEPIQGEDFLYWLVLQIMDMDQSSDPDPERPRFYSNVSVVAPSLIRDKMDHYRHPESGPFPDELLAEMAFEEGYRVPVWSAEGDNPLALMKQGVEQAPIIERMFGFFMDRPINRVGTTGWQLIKGQLY